jgi:hypothetical protein
MRVTDAQAETLNIVSGPTGMSHAETDVDEKEE